MSIHEECGVFGIYSPEQTDVASTTYYGLFALQHRGQESCGIVVNNNCVFKTHKEAGLVNDVFTRDTLNKLGLGNMALGHVRYGSVTTRGDENNLPLVVNYSQGSLAISYNGTLINADELRKELEEKGLIFHTKSDTEVIAYLITRERVNSESIEEAISKAMEKLEGAYSFIVMSPRKLMAVRDKRGMKPLCYGKTSDGRFIVASESCALDSVGAKLEREVKPGEIIVIEDNELHSVEAHCGEAPRALCIFEYIYFARPDSIIEKQSVHKARVIAGECLAKAHPVEADVVIGVPDSGLDAAVGYAKESGIPYGIGFIKTNILEEHLLHQDKKQEKIKLELN